MATEIERDKQEAGLNMQPLLPLQGLRSEPLASYCAALGVLRLVAQQHDPEATGWWHHDRFQLRSTFDLDALTDFFLHQYQPTPMASP